MLALIWNLLYWTVQPSTSIYSRRVFTLDMNVEVESLRMEAPLSQPPLQYNLSPRRSPAAVTGLDEPGVPHPGMLQTEHEGTFPFQACVDGFLHDNCMRIPGQTGTLFCQADVGVNPATLTVRAATRHEFAKQRENASTAQNKQFDSGG